MARNHLRIFKHQTTTGGFFANFSGSDISLHQQRGPEKNGGTRKKKTVSLGLAVFLPKNTSFFLGVFGDFATQDWKTNPIYIIPFFIAKTFAVCRQKIVEIAK